MTKVLMWNAEGEVRCEAHLPAQPVSAEPHEAWRRLTTNERVDLEAELGHPPACETCAAIARNGGGA